MPYKPFEPRDTLEEALSKLWGAAQEFVPTTRMEEIICMIANAQPTGIHAVPDIEEGDTGKVLTASEDGAVWASGGSGLPPATTLDYGKVLTLQKAPATMATIVPQQTLRILDPSDSYPLTNVDTSLVAEGVECTISIEGGAPQTGVIDSEWYLETSTITIDFNELTIKMEPAGSYTITVTTPSAYKAEPVWASGGGSGVVVASIIEDWALDLTWTQIKEYLEAKTPIFVWLAPAPDVAQYAGIYYFVTSVTSGDDEYAVQAYDLANGYSVVFLTDSADGHPVIDD